MARFEKVATPWLTVTVVVPVRVPPAGLRARLTMSVLSEVTMLLLASSTATVTAGVTVAPAGVLEGFWTNTSWVAAPGAMLKAAEVAGVREPDEAVRV